jgi:hypothetical protein
MKTTTNRLTAEMVAAAARNVPAAGNDSDRVYIYDVLVELIEGMGVWMDGEELRAELVSLHRAGQIVLTRCDMRGAHDADKLGADGTCTYLRSEWNLVSR